MKKGNHWSQFHKKKIQINTLLRNPQANSAAVATSTDGFY